MGRLLLFVVLLAPKCIPLGTDRAEDGSGGTECSFSSDCPFGEECSGAGGTCVPSECHSGDGDAIPPLPCPASAICSYADAVDLNHGNGICECWPGEHQVQECEFGQGGTFDLESCTCL